MDSGGESFESAALELTARVRAHSRASGGFMMSRRNRSLDEENARLKEMLQQSLKRELDGLSKIQHLQEMYQELLYKTHSDQEAKQYQLNCPESPKNNGTQTLSESSPQPLVIIKEGSTSSLLEKENETITKVNSSSLYNPKQAPPPATSTLAPIPVVLRDVRYEREKPPVLKEQVKLSKEVTFANRPLSPLTDKTSDSVDTPLTRKHKEMSRSDEFINKRVEPSLVERTDSNPEGGKVRQRSGSFWKRKTRVGDSGNCSTELIDNLFKNFTKSSLLKPDPLSQYLGLHWSDFCIDKECQLKEDRKYRDAVWELFQEEAKYFTRQLQPLEQIYKGFLEELHFHGYLREAKIDKIFANISELCELSSSIANDLLKLFDRRSQDNVAQPNELILSFSMFGHKFNPIYKCFCTNYEQQRGYIKSLEKIPFFQDYLRVCRTAPSVQRSDLTDLLIAPMQHQCHYQLLLDNVLKYTTDPNHRAVLHSTIKAFVVSLKELESAIAQQRRSLELLELSEMIQWPPVTQLTSESFVPQSMLDRVSEQPCSSLLKSSSCYLELQGTFKMLDSRGRPYFDVQLILLNNLLLLAEIKGGPANKKNRPYSLLYQPFPHEYISLHLPPESPRPLLTLLFQSSLGQQLAIVSLLAGSDEERTTWVNRLTALGAKQI